MRSRRAWPWMMAARGCGAGAGFGAMFSVGVLAGLLGCGHQPVRGAGQPSAPGYPAGGGAGQDDGARDNRTAGAGGRRSGEDSVGAAPGAAPAVPEGALPVSTEVGLASWYGTVYDHRRSANGEIYDQEAMTAASRTLPLGVLARVTNLADGEVAVVRITDRGPFIPGRIIDLSSAAAKAAGLYRMGVGRVRVEAFEPPGFVETPARWCVQVGAFADPDDAVQMKNDLLRRYGAAKVISFVGPTGSWVRLTLPVPDRAGADGVAEGVRVPDPGVAAYVTRTN